MQDVFRTRCGPQGEQPMVGVCERPPAADGDEARVAVFREDHGCTPFKLSREIVQSLNTINVGTAESVQGGGAGGAAATEPTTAPNMIPNTPAMKIVQIPSRKYVHANRRPNVQAVAMVVG